VTQTTGKRKRDSNTDIQRLSANQKSFSADELFDQRVEIDGSRVHPQIPKANPTTAFSVSNVTLSNSRSRMFYV
jgi:hypothetical protein